LLASLLRGLERIGGFGGKSDLLANYQTFLGDTNFLEKDFARYYAVTPTTIHSAARRWLHEGRAVMRVTPMPKYAAPISSCPRSNARSFRTDSKSSSPRATRFRQCS
jgi:zinc protease